MGVKKSFARVGVVKNTPELVAPFVPVWGSVWHNVPFFPTACT